MIQRSDVTGPWGAVTLWLFLSVAFLGGAPRWAALSLGAIALILGLVLRRSVQEGFGPWSLLYLGLGGFTLLTTVPLDCSATSFLAAETAYLWQSAHELSGAPGDARCALSLAPSASFRSAVEAGSLGVVAALAASAARRRGLACLALSVFLVASSVSVLALVHGMFGIERLFGLPSLPSRVAPSPVSVLVNPNNLAGYMNLGVFSGIALIVSRRKSLPDALLWLGTVLCFATLILTGSRGGVLVLAVGILLVGSSFLIRSRGGTGRETERARRRAGVVAAALLAGVLLSFLWTTAAIQEDLLGQDRSKLRELWKLTQALPEVGVWGIGRGAFESRSAHLLDEGGAFSHGYAENFVLSWLVEWGAMGGVALLVWIYLLWPFRLVLRPSRSAQIVWVGLTMLLLQNLVDVALELPGVASAAVVLGAGLDATRRERGSRAPLGRAFGAGWSFALSGVLAVASGLSAFSGPALTDERQDVFGAVQEARVVGASDEARANAQRAIARALDRFPAEPYFPLLGGWLALAERRDGMPWAAAALSRAPRSGAAHLLVAEVLLGHSATKQAFVHVRRAVESDPSVIWAAAQRVALVTHDPDLLFLAAPQGEPGSKFLLSVQAALPRAVDERTRRDLLEAAHARAPTSPRAAEALGLALLGDLRRAESPCPRGSDQNHCVPDPDTSSRIDLLARAASATPACDGLRLEARKLEILGHPREALGRLAACVTCATPTPCARQRVEAALAVGTAAERREAVASLLALSCASAEPCASAEDWLGSLLESRSEWALSASHFEEAARLVPTAERHLSAARAAHRAGLAVRARGSFERARALGARDPRLERELLGSQDAATLGVLPERGAR